MIATLVTLAIRAGIVPRFAKPVLIALAILLLVAVLGIGKCSYDRSVIRNHTTAQDAATAKADRKADTTAAEQRRADDTRANSERTELKEVIDEARSTGADPRAAYYACIARLQDARRRNLPSPTC